MDEQSLHEIDRLLHGDDSPETGALDLNSRQNSNYPYGLATVEHIPSVENFESAQQQHASDIYDELAQAMGD